MSVASGRSADLETATARMVRLGEPIEPHPATADLYDRMMPIFADLYEAAKPFYARLEGL